MTSDPARLGRPPPTFFLPPLLPSISSSSSSSSSSPSPLPLAVSHSLFRNRIFETHTELAPGPPQLTIQRLPLFRPLASSHFPFHVFISTFRSPFSFCPSVRHRFVALSVSCTGERAFLFREALGKRWRSPRSLLSSGFLRPRPHVVHSCACAPPIVNSGGKVSPAHPQSSFAATFSLGRWLCVQEHELCSMFGSVSTLTHPRFQSTASFALVLL